MAYTRTTWVNDVTALNADNMNNIEDGVEAVQVDDDVITAFEALGLDLDE